MSRPVSFKQFGSSDRELYRQYLDLYRAEEQLERDEFQVFGRDAMRVWKDSRGGVAGGSYGFGGDRVGAIQRAVSWRPTIADGRGDCQAGTVRSVGDLGAQSRGLPFDGVGCGDAGRGNSTGGRSDAPGGGDRGVAGTTAGVVDGADGESAVGAIGGGTDRPSCSGDGVSCAGVLKRGKHYEKNKAKRERAKALRDTALKEKEVRPESTKTLVSVRAAHPQLDDTWAERKIRENKVAIARLDAQLARFEKEQKDGTAEKRYQVEKNLVQGQLDGAFALVPQQRVVSWAKTIDTRVSSGSKSSGKKTVASIPSVSSGLGASSATSVKTDADWSKEVAALRKQLADANDKAEKVRLDGLRTQEEVRTALNRRIHDLETEVMWQRAVAKGYVPSDEQRNATVLRNRELYERSVHGR